MLKQTSASAKELEWRQDCFLPQSATTPKTNRSYFAEIGQSQKNAWQRLHQEQMNHSRMKIHQSMKVHLWLHRSKEVQCVCLLHASVLTTKRSMMMATKMFFFSPFYMNYKNTIGDQIIHKPLCRLDITMSQYIFIQIQKLKSLYFEVYRLHSRVSEELPPIWIHPLQQCITVYILFCS